MQGSTPFLTSALVSRIPLALPVINEGEVMRGAWDTKGWGEEEDGEAEKCYLPFFVGARDRKLTVRSRQRCSRWPCSNVLRLHCAIDSSLIAFSGSAMSAYSSLRDSRQ